MKYLRKLIPLAVFVIFLALIFIGIPSLIKVRKILCSSQFGPCKEDLTNQLAKVQGQSLKDARKNLNSLLANDISISKFSIWYKCPDILTVNIIEKKPKFAIKSSQIDKYVLVDKDGLATKIADSTNLPFIEIDEKPPNVGEKIKIDSLFALNVLYDIFVSYNVKVGKIKDSSLIIEIEPNLSVIFPLEGDREVLVGSLVTILDRLKEAEKESKIEVREIDLRFKNPVIR